MSEQDKKQPEDYETVQPFLKAAFEQFLAAGRGVRDMAEFSLERLGDTGLPYVNRFVAEVHTGQVKIKGLTASLHKSLFDGRPGPEERERMIREAAYFRAEQRGFVGGSPEDDWAEAEREVDAHMAAREGLIIRGRHAVESAGAAAGHGAEATYALVRQWLAGREGRAEEPPHRLAHLPESEAKAEATAASGELPSAEEGGAAGEQPGDVETPPAKAKKRRAAPRAKKAGEPAPQAKAAGTRARKPRPPQTPRGA
ncbi:MAG: DUF2934 domain-containing protein [Thioalkalivibrio sp.]|nr:DUF2934 domain-containing protein [Thioalkalivibrio sp.]